MNSKRSQCDENEPEENMNDKRGQCDQMSTHQDTVNVLGGTDVHSEDVIYSAALSVVVPRVL